MQSAVQSVFLISLVVAHAHAPASLSVCQQHDVLANLAARCNFFAGQLDRSLVQCLSPWQASKQPEAGRVDDVVSYFEVEIVRSKGQVRKQRQAASRQTKM